MTPHGEAAPLDIAALRSALVAVAVAADVGPMEAYMKHRAPFIGVKSPARRAAAAPFLRRAKGTDVEAVLAFADACWAEPEREFQYVATDMLCANAKRLQSTDLPAIEEFIVEKSWWDTVDPLASHVVGALVANDAALLEVMDEWIDSDNMWLARTAILHQLRYKEKTDTDRLFAYAIQRAEDREFFIRKALGWALRQYARVDPDAVVVFVGEHEDTLSGLTKREALKRCG